MRPTRENGKILETYVELAKKLDKLPNRTELEEFISERQVRKHFGNLSNLKKYALKYNPELDKFENTNQDLKVLIFDIETAPILGYVWKLFDNNIALNQIYSDWHVLSWSAKWLGTPENQVMYMDQRNAPNVENDKEILKGIWKLLDEADVVITQNGKSFDQKKLNTRFIFNNMQPPSSYKHIDVKRLASKHFGFTSNKLEYMTDKLCVKYKKLKHTKFSGFELWRECLKGNKEAWKEMEKYNRYDVLSLEELYTKLIPWDDEINFNLFHNNQTNVCKCGNDKFTKKGFYFTSSGKYQRYKCTKCGAETRGFENLFSPNKKKSLRTKVVR